MIAPIRDTLTAVWIPRVLTNKRRSGLRVSMVVIWSGIHRRIGRIVPQGILLCNVGRLKIDRWKSACALQLLATVARPHQGPSLSFQAARAVK